jgi:hypothetical protein
MPKKPTMHPLGTRIYDSIRKTPRKKPDSFAVEPKLGVKKLRS